AGETDEAAHRPAGAGADEARSGVHAAGAARAERDASVPAVGPRRLSRRKATRPQTASARPKGTLPIRKPYTLEATHAAAKRPTKVLCRPSSAYASTIAETAAAPKTVTRTA